MKSLKTLFSVTLVLIIVGVVFLMDIPTFMMIKRGQVKNFNELSPNELQVNEPVKGTIEMSIGACAEQYKTKFGIRISSGSTLQYYVLWMRNSQAEDHLILYETGDSDEYATLDKITDETVKYFETLNEAEESQDYSVVIPPKTEMAFEGVVREPSSELMGLFKSYYDEAFGTNDFNEYAEPLMISRRSFSAFTGTVIAGLICAALGIILGIVTFILWRKSKKEGY
ncbi:MAG: hypothetical protein IK130_03870 [Oscillospiraceae bacterium]|nr:hypothetical protein [Oscillospiraceae bacterium]